MVGVGGILLGVYLGSLAPTVSFGGDTGELIAASYLLGNAHPPGYPLYLLLARLWALLPWGEVAWRVNLLSACAGAAAGAFLYGALWRWSRSRIASGFAALLLGTTYSLWSQAVIAEVYSLAAALFAALLWLHVRWFQEEDARALASIGLLYGLAAAHHLSVAQAALVTALVLGWGSPEGRAAARRLGTMFLGMAPGLALYLYLPLRAHQHPPLNWGDPSCWERFWRHVTAAEYRGYLFSQPLGEVAALAVKYAVFWALQWHFGLLFLPQGWRSLRRLPTLWRFTVAAALLNIGLALNYHVSDRHHHFLPTFLLTGFWVGCGVAETERAWASRIASWRPLLPLSLLLPLAWQWNQTVLGASQRGQRLAKEWGEAILEASPSESLLVVESDEILFTLWYLRWVEGKGKGREIVKVKALLQDEAKGLWETEAAIERGRKIGRPVALTFWHPRLEERYFLAARGPVCLPLEQARPMRGQRAAGSSSWQGTPRATRVKVRTLTSLRIHATLPIEGLEQGRWVLFGWRKADRQALLAGRKSPGGIAGLLAFEEAYLTFGPWLLRPGRLESRPSAAWVEVEDEVPLFLPQACLPGEWEIRLGWTTKPSLWPHADLPFILRHTQPIATLQAVAR